MQQELLSGRGSVAAYVPRTHCHGSADRRLRSRYEMFCGTPQILRPANTLWTVRLLRALGTVSNNLSRVVRSLRPPAGSCQSLLYASSGCLRLNHNDKHDHNHARLGGMHACSVDYSSFSRLRSTSPLTRWRCRRRRAGRHNHRAFHFPSTHDVTQLLSRSIRHTKWNSATNTADHRRAQRRIGTFDQL